MFILANVYVPFDVNQYTNRVATDKLDLNGTKITLFFCFFSIEKCVVGTHWKRLTEALPMGARNTSFC